MNMSTGPGSRRRRASRSVPRGFAWALAVAIAVGACRVIYLPYSHSSGSVTVSTLRLSTSDISGWTEREQGGFGVYVGDELYGPMNGGAPQYLQKGMIEASIQHLESPDGKLLDSYVLDYGISANAEAMFREKKAIIADSRLVASFPEDIAIVDYSILGGCMAYAHFERFYVELALTGYADKTFALQAADLFLRIYKEKIL